jgi:hypothetical protein
MNSPTDLTLPFFAYGLFRPGQIAYFQIRDYVRTPIIGANVKGRLLIRDGLPILDPNGNKTVDGSLLHFRDGDAPAAYEQIVGLEPDKHYRWGTARINGESANMLLGISPDQGSVSLEETDEHEWDGWNDPLFTTALDVVQDTIRSNTVAERDMKPLFGLQMAYLLLWSAIERYLSLRYNLSDRVMGKVKKLSMEPAFLIAVKTHVKRKHSIYRADRPAEKGILDPKSPELAASYYYQVRSNITHRGKGVFRDHETLLNSTTELLTIFCYVLAEAKKDAQP